VQGKSLRRGESEGAKYEVAKCSVTGLLTPLGPVPYTLSYLPLTYVLDLVYPLAVCGGGGGVEYV
jgi:hypothetical protein